MSYRKHFTTHSAAVLAALCLAVPHASANIIGVAGGTAAPSSTLGPFTMVPFAADATPEFTDVTSVTSPLGGSLGFSLPLTHVVAGSSWGNWSHGYTGDVYWTGGQKSVELTLPPDTVAFYFFAQPNPFDLFEITAQSQDGTTVAQTVSGDAGAAGYGFYGTGGDVITKITIASSEDFAVGEFGIAKGAAGSGGGGTPVPDSGKWAITMAAVCLGGANRILRNRCV